MNHKNKWKILYYYFTFPHKIPYIPKEKKKFIYSVRLSMRSFLAEHPSASMDEIYREFGTTEQLCEDYMDNITQEQLMDGVRYTRQITKCLFMLVVLLFFLCTGYYFHMYLYAPPDIHYLPIEKLLEAIDHIMGGAVY